MYIPCFIFHRYHNLNPINQWKMHVWEEHGVHNIIHTIQTTPVINSGLTLDNVFKNTFVIKCIFYRKMCAVPVTDVSIPVSKVAIESSLCGSKLFFV